MPGGLMGFAPNGGQLRQNSLGAAALQLRQNQQGVAIPVAQQLDMRTLKMTDLPFYQVLDVVYQPTCLTPLNPTVKVNPLESMYQRIRGRTLFTDRLLLPKPSQNLALLSLILTDELHILIDVKEDCQE
jgi:hypothetical protein